MVANEHFCMTLAARMGLPVAPVEIRRIQAILLIERFDRIVTTEPDDPTRVSAVRRLHVIDGCQALDLPATLKYERNLGNNADVRNIREGVSFEKLFSLTPYLETPAAARGHAALGLLQLLIGNSDAHGKNISFFVSGGGLAPAPLTSFASTCMATRTSRIWRWLMGCVSHGGTDRVRARGFCASHTDPAIVRRARNVENGEPGEEART